MSIKGEEDVPVSVTVKYDTAREMTNYASKIVTNKEHNVLN